MLSDQNIYIKQLNLEEARAVYIGHSHQDFPSDELKPFSMIEKLWNNKCYFGYGFYEADGKNEVSAFSETAEIKPSEHILRAYAFLMADDSTNMLLLDYFAVCEEARGKGYGSAALNLLKENCIDWDGILFEVEDETGAESEEEKLIRRRRIAFYEKSGVIMTDTKSHVFGVDYKLMVMPLASEAAGEHIDEKLTSMYKLMLPKMVFEREFQLRYEYINGDPEY